MIGRYLFSVTACALAVSLACGVPQKNSIGRIVRLIGGAIMLIALLRPLIRLRVGDPEALLRQYAPDEAMISSAVEAGEKESARLITGQTRAYILDKAGELGASLNAEVELAALSEHYQYPYRVTLRGHWTSEQKQALCTYIAQTLGIPEERQIWVESE